jgi:hypothetical protein
MMATAMTEAMTMNQMGQPAAWTIASTGETPGKSRRNFICRLSFQQP